MKQITYIVIILILASCNNGQKKRNEELSNILRDKSDTVKETYPKDLENETSNIIDSQKETIFSEFKNAQHYRLNDTIIADFNGDGVVDKAFFIIKDKTSGIIIISDFTKDTVKIGFETEFAHLTNFNWVDFWGLVKDKETYEILFNETDIIGDTTVTLDNPSIVVRKEEVGGGIITFKKGKYIWIHQSD